MEYKKTAFHCEAGVATITMDCPENLNAIDVDMAKELLERLYQCDRSSEVKVVVLKGGVRAFSAGGDIRYLYDNIQRGVVESSELVVLVGQLALVMKQLNKLVICAVSGSAAGAGANLALSGDFVVCSENARFIQAFVGIALVPDTGGPYLLSRSIGAQRALEMCITGRPVPAEEALRLGLVHEICPREELEERTMALARKLAAGPLFAYGYTTSHGSCLGDGTATSPVYYNGHGQGTICGMVDGSVRAFRETELYAFNNLPNGDKPHTRVHWFINNASLW